MDGEGTSILVTDCESDISRLTKPVILFDSKFVEDFRTLPTTRILRLGKIEGLKRKRGIRTDNVWSKPGREGVRD